MGIREEFPGKSAEETKKMKEAGNKYMTYFSKQIFKNKIPKGLPRRQQNRTGGKRPTGAHVLYTGWTISRSRTSILGRV